MSIRAEWKFTHAAADLIPYAEKKRALHLERYGYWKDELEQARIAKGALETADDEAFDERANNLTQYGTSAGRDTPQQRIDDAKSKCRQHLHEAETFGRFIRAFEGHRAQVLELDPQDIEYFGI